jgi:PqqD family protein of HPr-rel-A system
VRWQVAHSARFELRHFGDESVLYDPRSGLTHFLSAVAVEALELLREGPFSSEELTQQLVERCAVDSIERFAEELESLLHQLARLDFIEAVSRESC